jgi:hypothetical protein
VALILHLARSRQHRTTDVVANVVELGGFEYGLHGCKKLADLKVAYSNIETGTPQTLTKPAAQPHDEDTHHTDNTMPHALKDQEIAMLRTELEMLMKERDDLLQVTGAAAGLIAELDSFDIPNTAMEAAELLSTRINTLPEETLQDALSAVNAHSVG